MMRTCGRRRVRLSIAVPALVVATMASACGGGGGKNAPLSGISKPSKDATIAAEVPKSFSSKGSLIVATDASYAPDEFFAPDNKTIEGMSVDLGTAIGLIMGLDWKFQNAKFDTIIPGLQSGKFDVGFSSFTDNAEREQVVDFVNYFRAGASIFVNASTKTNFRTLDQLCGQPVSVERATTELDDANAASKKCTDSGQPAIKVLVFDDQNGANLAVTSGRAVASLADSQVADYQVKISNGKLRVTGDYLAPEPYGIALPRPRGAAPGSGPLTRAVQDALQKLMDDGTYKAILDKWGIAAGAIPKATVNAGGAGG